MFCHCFDENIYIFELFGLTLICKELALLACRLTIVYPALTHNTYQLPVCQTSKETQPFSIFIVSHELWSCCLSWYQRLVYWGKLDVSVSWSGIRIRHRARASSKIYEMTHLIFILLAALFCHIYETMCDFFFCLFLTILSLIFILIVGVEGVNTQYPHSDYYFEKMFALVPNVSMQ